MNALRVIEDAIRRNPTTGQAAARSDPGRRLQRMQVYFNAGLAYVLNRTAGEAHCVAAPSSLIGASNFFELAVAAAISLFGFKSGAALATVVGVLIEVPVMLSVVRIVNATKGWYERGGAVRRMGRAPTGGTRRWAAEANSISLCCELGP
jgi:hypothetical protein